MAARNPARKPPARRTLPEVVPLGERRHSLEAVRDLLAVRLEAADERASAPLAKMLVDVMRELADLSDTGEARSVVDDLTARRTSRRATATGS